MYATSVDDGAIYTSSNAAGAVVIPPIFPGVNNNNDDNAASATVGTLYAVSMAPPIYASTHAAPIYATLARGSRALRAAGAALRDDVEFEKVSLKNDTN